MKKLTAFISAVLLVASCSCFFILNSNAHSGRTDSNGGHTNHATGEYHYHHGMPAHNHYDIDGDGRIDCPYTFDYDSMSEAESNDSKWEFEFSIHEYSNDFSMPTFSRPEYTPMPEYNKTKDEESNVSPAYLTLSFMGIVVLIMIISYIFGRRR